ncbi:acetyltransferase GNAT family protein [Asticcacaulis biprosthecium C19]|uniref:Acetyltransferase GNAT family protein n=1 Tax=Asticcacaulis biprosthecium C19 TaxID=715226 RepID=F4QU69_9CAUL|nr:arsenic resistance N-acetyltransferase ArsN2 [Asticcacaulis biprosthecium]EGF89369.1 acetyltransferase GNAT family protein [Asticcacaulis biprosthecium C19]
MSDKSFVSVPAFDADLISALASEGLPVSDLGQPHQVVWQLDCNGQTAGYVALETYGDAALLRSLVVLPEAKGQGHGAALVAYAADQAHAMGIRELWLLTHTAADFFVHLGWQTRDRSDAPPALAASAEFASLCPASATCFSRVTAAE